MTDRYVPLERFLTALPASQHEITLSFEQVERILNEKLPPSAHKYPAWWANEKNGRHVQAHAWMNANWKKDTVNLKKKWVRFERERDEKV
jgi:hypothetical protein